MTITLITAGLIGLLHTVLTINVGRWCQKTQTANGDGGDETLRRAIRAHANNAEFAPFMLILIAALEYMHGSNYLLIPCAVLFVMARVSHGYGLGFTDGSVRFYRMFGAIMTLLVMLVLSIAALVVGYGIA